MTSTSIVIPSYQGAQKLNRLLGCLALQETDVEWEAVIVLDGSTDDSRQIVDRWADRVPVRLVDLGTNRGRPAALNAGFEAASGRVLIRCDDDLAPSPDFVATHTAHHRDREDLGAIGYYRNILPETVYAAAYGRHASQLALQAVYRTAEDLRWMHWAGNCSATRAMFDRVGPYDEQFSAYGWEDVDWGYRLRLAGASFVIDQQLEVDHYIASTTAAIRCRRAYLSGSAQSRFLAKHKLASIGDRAANHQRSLWNTAVAATSKLPVSSRESLASGVDRVGGHLPAGVTRKLIALCVESSGRAGLRAGPEVPEEISRNV
jgi:glycosyltransferase involved in cell wall biosynthesis